MLFFKEAVGKHPKYKTATDRDIQDKCASFFTNSRDCKKKTGTEELNYVVEEQNFAVESDSE